ncbi:hypothetical protein [Xanthomonas albilineans]|uniref:hypothetical protein n=1 Tax=Xanthomonas albilineans TaxID=29447 RepID=UPI0005F30830|nr:hypothetical protein [Xanthomonas albilineans]
MMINPLTIAKYALAKAPSAEPHQPDENLAAAAKTAMHGITTDEMKKFMMQIMMTEMSQDDDAPDAKPKLNADTDMF